MSTSLIQRRVFGRTGQEVTCVGLGGEGVLRTYKRTDEAVKVIGEAVGQGISYFDSARAYAGSEGYYGAYWPANQEKRQRVFQASKSASRDKKGALADLDHTSSGEATSELMKSRGDTLVYHTRNEKIILEIRTRPGLRAHFNTLILCSGHKYGWYTILK